MLRLAGTGRLPLRLPLAVSATGSDSDLRLPVARALRPAWPAQARPALRPPVASGSVQANKPKLTGMERYIPLSSWLTEWPASAPSQWHSGRGSNCEARACPAAGRVPVPVPVPVPASAWR